MAGDRFQLSRRSVLLGTAASAFVASRGVAAVDRPAAPNILFIMADDLGYADLSCYGRRDYETPVLDQLAGQGMRFTQAYANSAVCSATRLALITGRYQYRLPAGLEEPIAVRNIGLPASHPTLPSILRSVGYQTSLIGKWHLGPLPDYGPLQSGYDQFWGFRGGGVDYFTHLIGGRRDLWDGDVEAKAVGYLTDVLGDRAIAQLNRFSQTNTPFFMSLHFSAPHFPWEGPDDEAEAQRLALNHEPMAMFHLDGGTLKTYAAMVRRMDFQIGRVLARLEQLGFADNTIVVFTSDNGGERFSDTWPFSGRKTELLEGGLRVPAIVRWPGTVRAGSSSPAQIITMDWMPTLLAAAGTQPNSEFPSDGIDLAQILSGAQPEERPLFWRYKFNNQEAMRLGDWKYLKIKDNSFLFNIEKDPQERANLKKQFSGKFSSMVENWNKWNESMLPLDPASFTHGFSGSDIADRMGLEPTALPDLKVGQPTAQH